jgi:dipeptidyl aminopeptidase/acylaminoacyl peptidase
MSNLVTRFSKSFQSIDRAALLLMLVLSLVIGGLLLKGDRTAAKVRDFSWQGRQVGANDAAFILTFSRPMDHASVEQHLRLAPPLPGKASWAGRRMAYTLDMPAPYGETFNVILDKARDRFSSADDTRAQMQPYTGTFQTRDRAFVYLGVNGETAGRLVLQNLTQQEQKILTPDNLVVIDFKPYPDGDRILFSATDRATQQDGMLDQQLYTVTTGITVQAPANLADAKSSLLPQTLKPKPNPAAGVVTQVLDNKEYQNLKFDLSPDGQTIVVQRVNKQNPADLGLWMLKADMPPVPIKTQPGGDFLIAPDSHSLAMAQGQGMAILPLDANAEALDFLPKFGVVLSFAKDGSAAAMVKFNTDPNNPTRSLFIVTNQGSEKELLKTDGSILSAQFAPTKTNLYCLFTRRVPGDTYVEEPYLAAVNLATGKQIDLLRLPVQRDIQMSLAPDGLGILFDQILSTTNDSSGDAVVRGSEGKAIANSQLWFLPLLQDKAGIPLQTQPQPLDLPGLHPLWLP